ncbi:MAG: YhcH/YjgK/YiaL family protein [Bacteroidales bacterium]
MICDVLQNFERYRSLFSHFDTIHAFLCRNDLAQLPLQRIDLASGVYVSIGEYQTKPAQALRWEAHRKYLDIQYLVWGEEKIGYGAGDDFRCIEPYDEAKDIAFFSGSGYELPLGNGFFVVLFPGEYHMPGIIAHAPALVRKVVVKVQY